MKITEFLEGRDTERQAVTRYINRHNEIFNGHIEKVGKELELDAVAVKELEKAYPLPKPVQVVNGVPKDEFIRVQKELINSKDVINELRSRLMEAQEQISEAKANAILLEDKRQLVAELEKRIDRKDEEINKLHDDLNMLHEDLATEKSKTWFQKLLGR
jgi:predicted transcriptional regulator